MNKISKIASKVFYYSLGSSLLLGIAFFGFEIFNNSPFLVVYAFIYVILPLVTVSLLVALILNFKDFGFLGGIKASSNAIFALALWTCLLWFLRLYAFEKSNQMNVTIINKTELGISNIRLAGRNALTKIDTLAPEDNKTIIFKGKRINYNTENNYENEIRLLYYFKNKWREHKILSGFNRFRKINNDWEINIYGVDSIEVKQQ